MSKLSKINDLAFDLMHEYMEPSKQFSYGKQIYDLSDEPELSENQQIVLNLLKKIYNKNEIKMNITAVFWVLHQNYLEDEFSEESLAYEELSLDKELQVVKVFFNWIEQEEAE